MDHYQRSQKKLAMGVEPTTPGLQNQCSTIELCQQKRKGWDLNPRWTFAHGDFQDRCDKPLRHPSK